MFLKGFKSDSKWLAVAIFASVATIVPMLIYGIPFGSVDQAHHLQIANAYYRSIVEWTAYIDWNGPENHGYGSVVARFYPPLFHSVLGFLRFVMGSWSMAVIAAFFFWSAFGNVGVWLLSKEHGLSSMNAAVASVFFSLTPYHLNQIYNSFMWGEFVSLAVIPYCFLFAKRLFTNENLWNPILFGLSLALLVLANLPQAVIGAISIGIYLVFVTGPAELKRHVFNFAVAGVVAIGLSAFYVVRVIVEMPWLKVAGPNLDPNYDYNNHFLFLFSNATFEGQGIWLASFIFVGTIVILGIVGAASGRPKTVFTYPSLRPIIAITVISSIMMLPFARPIWDVVEPLQRVQFPWRFLSLLSLTSAIIFGYYFQLAQVPGANRRPKTLIFAGLLLVVAVFSIKQIMLGATPVAAAEFDGRVEQIWPQIGLDHWHPIWVDSSAFSIDNKVEADSGPIDMTDWSNMHRTFEMGNGGSGSARLGMMYYPHWQAWVNGMHAETHPGAGGVLKISLPPGPNRVQVSFIEPRYTYISRIVSLAAAALLVIGLFRSLRKRRKLVKI
jgi:hypothetical protein